MKNMLFDAWKKIRGNAGAMDTRLSARLISVFALALVALALRLLPLIRPKVRKFKLRSSAESLFLTNEDNSDPRPGAQALMGIALLKNGVPPNHPKIQGAVTLVKRQIPDNDPAQAIDREYLHGGLVDHFPRHARSGQIPQRNRLLVQISSMPSKKSTADGDITTEDPGDTSMTQYGVLSSWEAKQAGFEIPMYTMEGVADWLMRTQDPSGGFAYQGQDRARGNLGATGPG